MKKVFFLLLFTKLIVGQSSAQQQNSIFNKTDWSAVNPGTGEKQDFVIVKSGELVFGSIKRNYNFADYEEVDFESESGRMKYYPADILGFGLDNGQLFQSKSLPDTSEPVFLQVLMSGPIQLGSYKGGYFLDDGNVYEKLEAFYKKTSVNEGPSRKYFKPYIGTLKRFLPGECGVMLYSSIDRIPYSDLAFIRILSSFFLCNQAAYQVHIAKVPVVKVSPILGFGISQFFLSESLRTEGRVDRLVSKLGYQVFAGFRLHDSRKLPRVSSDLRIAISTFQSQVLSSFTGNQRQNTGSESIRETAIYIPLSLNYNVLKRPNWELSLGAFVAYCDTKVDQEGGRVDERILPENEVYLYESPITLEQGSDFISGGRIGALFALNEKIRLFAELEASLQRDYYQFSLLQNQSYYDRSKISIQLGLEF